MSGRIVIGDALAELREMPCESVNCVVTSPPYWGLRNYGVEGQLGLESTPAEYVAKMVDVFREVRRVLRSDGVLWLNLGDCYASGPLTGDANRVRDDKRGYRGDRLANGRKDQSAVLRKKTRATRDGSHAGKHTGIAAGGPMTQVNRLPIDGLKPKDMVGIPWRVAFALQADGWWLRSDIIWHKPQPMPESVRDRPTRAHEYLFLLTKSASYYYSAEAIKEPVTGGAKPRRATGGAPYQPGKNEEAAPSRPDGHSARTKAGFNERWRVKQNDSFMSATSDHLVETRNKRSVWTIPTQPNPEAHFATFPEALVTPCVLAGCPAGGVVMDPFGGTGTVARVAEDLGRNWLLIELNPEYAAMAERRMRQQGLLGLIDSPPTAPNPPPTSEPVPAPDGVSAGSGSALGTHGGEGAVGDLLQDSQSTSGETAPPAQGPHGVAGPDVDDPCEGLVGNAPRLGGPPATAASASPGTVATSNKRRGAIILVDANGVETLWTGGAT